MNDDPKPNPESNVIDMFAAPKAPDISDLHEAVDAARAAELELERLRALNVHDLVLEYLGNRDRLEDERHRFQRVEADIKATLVTMSMVMREKADALGVDAFPIRGVGTAYRNQKTSYRMQDWTAFVAWVDETKNFQCLEKRVAKLATAEVERGTGKVPPGVDKVTEVEFLVRRDKA